MKPIHTLAATALLALVSAGMASATTTIVHVTGSTAYRNATVSAEANLVGSGAKGMYFDTGGSAALVHASTSIVYGPLSGSGNQIIFENHFTGSVGGLQVITEQLTDASMPSQSNYAATATTLTLGGTGVVPTGGQFVDSASNTLTKESALIPDVTLSDVSPNTGKLIYTPTHTPTDSVVGIVPFKFVASVGSDLTNITDLQFQTLASAGVYPAAFFTGLAADETKYIYLLGRDIDSGTRAQAFANTAYGIASLPVQYYPYDSATDSTNNTLTGVVGLSGSGTTINGINFVPAETVDGISEGYNTGGYASGGNLASAMKATSNVAASGAYFVTYLGLSDASTATGGGAVALSYNGVAFSAAAVEEGAYTFFGNEHFDYLSTSSTDVKNVITKLKNQLNAGDDTISAGGVTVSAMKVSRSDDGQALSITYSPTYPY